MAYVWTSSVNNLVVNLRHFITQENPYNWKCCEWNWLDINTKSTPNRWQKCELCWNGRKKLNCWKVFWILILTEKFILLTNFFLDNDWFSDQWTSLTSFSVNKIHHHKLPLISLIKVSSSQSLNKRNLRSRKRSESCLAV